jgi:hypothetical protein
MIAVSHSCYDVEHEGFVSWAQLQVNHKVTDRLFK